MSGLLVLWQDADAHVHGQCVVGKRENLNGVNLVRARCLSGEVVSYTPKAFSPLFNSPSQSLRISLLACARRSR